MVEDTENPKVSGYSANNFFKRVDLPVPLGPEITIGRDIEARQVVYRSLLCYADKYKNNNPKKRRYVEILLR